MHYKFRPSVFFSCTTIRSSVPGYIRVPAASKATSYERKRDESSEYQVPHSSEYGAQIGQSRIDSGRVFHVESFKTVTLFLLRSEEASERLCDARENLPVTARCRVNSAL